VIPIDQGEELFNEEGRVEATRFIGMLSKTLVADPRVLALITMRTDSFPQVQNDSVLAALPKDTFTLDKMLEGSYREIIEGPAALVKPTPLKIDPELTENLLKDAAGQDALALLAFTLRYLYDKYRANNELSREGYEKLGRLRGVIETTVKQAVAEGVRPTATASPLLSASPPPIAAIRSGNTILASAMSGLGTCSWPKVISLKL
jgi:hypothetical protein